jgi:catechol 2,3-dioxygenase-like lactoylglutathione lyase family enzyme
MKISIIGLILGLSSTILVYQVQEPKADKQEQKSESEKNSEPEPKAIRLGNFSVSLNVKDIQASIEFYQKLGFRQVGGDPKQRWIVLQNEQAKIGLFQGMLEKNSLTFNPGWDSETKTLDDFDDVRDIQKELVSRGIELAVKADELTDGPAFVVLNDPDGNPILIDQHVPKKK